METGGASVNEGMKRFFEDFAKGRITTTDEIGVRGGPQHRRHARLGGVRERPHPAHPVHADDGEGVRAAARDRAAVHQQVLHPRPAAGELVRRLRRRPGPHGVRRLLAQRQGGPRHQDLGRLPARRADEGDRRRARDHGRRPGEHARLLRRRHAARVGRGGDEHQRRREDREHDAADVDARFLGHRRDRAPDRREVGRRREASIGKGGLLQGKELGFVFSSLRANDLIWPYVVNSYLKGKGPPAFDLLYWNSDATNLPGPMFCWYVRQHVPARTTCAFPARRSSATCRSTWANIDFPTYVYASREDHIVPWKSARTSRRAS